MTTAAAAPSRFVSRDVWIAGVAALGAVALSLAIAAPVSDDADSEVPVIAAVQRATGEVKLRPARTLGWQGLARSREVREGDAVFVPPGGEATLRFEDGTELLLDERSLVVVESPRAGRQTVTLRQGALSGRAGSAGVTLATKAGEATLNAASEARVELSGETVEVSVKKGAASVGTQGASTAVTAGQRVAAAGQGTRALAAWPVVLTAPDANFRRVFRGAPGAIELRWEGAVPPGARVQISRDRLFAFVERDAGAEGGALLVERAGAGVTWWRVVDAAGQPLSESRRFTLVEDVAPRTMFPRAGDVLLAPPGTRIGFAWTQLPGVHRYRVEFSPSQGFEPITFSTQVEGAEGRVTLSLDEGTWFWRVRSDDDSEGLPSAPSRFRLIHKGIPDAPELLNPEIEVTP